jgi:hypothetical protein
MNRAEPRIVFIDRAARIVEDAHAGGILEEQRAIVAAQLAGMAAEGRNMNDARGGMVGCRRQTGPAHRDDWDRNEERPDAHEILRCPDLLCRASIETSLVAKKLVIVFLIRG